jgi:phosphoserine phosphatase RsbU/P
VDERDDALRWLLAASHRARPEDVPLIVQQLAPVIGVDEMVIYLADYNQKHLVPLPQGDFPVREAAAIDRTLAGRAFRDVAAVRAATPAQDRLWLPLVDGAERLGVLEVVAAVELTGDLRTTCEELASLLGEVLVTRRKYGDTFEITRRRSVMTLPAELMWTLLPHLTFATDRVVITGILEPAYEVGGDAFDYAVNGDIAHFAIFDAMGHGLDATLLATVVLGAYRNARRSGLNLADTYRSIDKWIRAKLPDTFVTAVLAELDTASGRYRGISAGHPPVLLLRNGHLVKTLPSPTALPLGLGDWPPGLVEETLERGDRILLFTDGVVEARGKTGDFFGVERLVDFVCKALADRLPAPETMRRLVNGILEHQDGELQDDASVIFVEWSG